MKTESIRTLTAGPPGRSLALVTTAADLVRHRALVTALLVRQLKLRYRECDVRGKAVVSIRWAAG